MGDAVRIISLSKGVGVTANLKEAGGCLFIRDYNIFVRTAIL
jgi:hypothetical protein